jgi:hypothetical protein
LIERHLAFVRQMHGEEVLGDDFSMMDVRFWALMPEARPVPAG